MSSGIPGSKLMEHSIKVTGQTKQKKICTLTLLAPQVSDLVLVEAEITMNLLELLLVSMIAPVQPTHFSVVRPQILSGPSFAAAKGGRGE